MKTFAEDAGDTKRGGQDSGWSIAVQWFGVLAPATAWLLNLEGGYSLAHAACHGSGMMPLHLASVAALALAALGGAAGIMQRSRMLAALGLGSAAFFLTMIVVQWIPAFVLHPCWLT